MFFDILEVTGEVPKPFGGRPPNSRVELPMGARCGGMEITSARAIRGVDNEECRVSIAGGERGKPSPLWPGDRMRLLDEHVVTITFAKGSLVLRPIGVSDAPKSNPEMEKVTIPSEPSSVPQEGYIRFELE